MNQLLNSDEKTPQQPGKAEGVKGGTAEKLSHTTNSEKKEHAKRHSFGGYLGRYTPIAACFDGDNGRKNGRSGNSNPSDFSHLDDTANGSKGA